MIREINKNDLKGLLELYTHLHEKEVPEIDDKVLGIWNTIINDPNHHIIVAEEDGKIVSSCVCLIIPNLTRGLRPHAFIENVVTDSAYRKRGLATACLNYAKEIAGKSPDVKAVTNFCLRPAQKKKARSDSTSVPDITKKIKLHLLSGSEPQQVVAESFAAITVSITSSAMR